MKLPQKKLAAIVESVLARDPANQLNPLENTGPERVVVYPKDQYELDLVDIEGLSPGDDVAITDAVQNSMAWESQPYEQKAKFVGLNGRAMLFDTLDGYKNVYGREDNRHREVFVWLDPHTGAAEGGPAITGFCSPDDKEAATWEFEDEAAARISAAGRNAA